MIAAQRPSGRSNEATRPLTGVTAREPRTQSFDPSRGRREVKIDARGVELIRYGTANIDLRCVEQLVDPSQTRAVGFAIFLATERFMKGGATLRDVIERVEAFFDERGLDDLDPLHQPERHPGNLARPRRFEIAAAINRLRTLQMSQRRRRGGSSVVGGRLPFRARAGTPDSGTAARAAVRRAARIAHGYRANGPASVRGPGFRRRTRAGTETRPDYLSARAIVISQELDGSS